MLQDCLFDARIDGTIQGIDDTSFAQGFEILIPSHLLYLPGELVVEQHTYDQPGFTAGCQTLSRNTGIEISYVVRAKNFSSQCSITSLLAWMGDGPASD